MQILSLKQALDLSGVYDNDNVMERDMKFNAWIDKRKYRIIDLAELADQTPKAEADGIEVLIIKETNYVRKS